MATPLPQQPVDANSLVGTFRRFGEYGPVYEILTMRKEGPVTLVDVEVPETGAKTTVRLEDVLADPEAR
ncbi:MAG: DUF5397 family protein [Deltaproteobacteria bacterium]|nr:DUF5397 family protein [Deltaproteobacteria bacterium]